MSGGCGNVRCSTRVKRSSWAIGARSTLRRRLEERSRTTSRGTGAGAGARNHSRTWSSSSSLSLVSESLNSRSPLPTERPSFGPSVQSPAPRRSRAVHAWHAITYPFLLSVLAIYLTSTVPSMEAARVRALLVERGAPDRPDVRCQLKPESSRWPALLRRSSARTPGRRTNLDRAGRNMKSSMRTSPPSHCLRHHSSRVLTMPQSPRRRIRCDTRRLVSAVDRAQHLLHAERLVERVRCRSPPPPAPGSAAACRASICTIPPAAARTFRLDRGRSAVVGATPCPRA